MLLSALMITPAMASNPDLQSFEEICEITGEVKTSYRISPEALSVVEPLELE